MEKICFNGTSLEQDGNAKHLIQFVLLDKLLRNNHHWKKEKKLIILDQCQD
jgi:hypothetical protein